MCVHHACLQRQGPGARRAPEGAKKQTPPPPRSECERNHSERGGQEGQSEQKGSRPPLPPPRTSAAPRACIVPATCMPRWKGQHEAPPLPTPTEGGRGRRGDGRERQEKWGGDTGASTRPERVTGGKRSGQMAGTGGSNLNPARKPTSKEPDRGRAEGEGGGQAGHGRSPGEQKGAREGRNTREESGRSGANTAGGGGGERGLHGTLARGPASGVWGPPG